VWKEIDIAWSRVVFGRRKAKESCISQRTPDTAFTGTAGRKSQRVIVLTALLGPKE
jgi:hypothetical protein